MRGLAELAASPALGGIVGVGKPGGGEGRGARWEGRLGIFVHGCLKEGLLGAQGLGAGEGPLWQSEQKAGRFCERGKHSDSSHQHASQKGKT